MSNEITMYNGKVWGKEVSQYGLEHGYLDYRTLSNLLDGVIHNDNLIDIGEWETASGNRDEEVSYYFIISSYGAQVLKDYTDELVLYNEELELYLWGVDHSGTRWDCVLTNIKLVDGDK